MNNFSFSLNSQIKKLVAKGSKGRYATNRGTAKRGGGRKPNKKKKKATKPN